MRPKLTAEMTKSLRVGSSPQQVEGALGAPKTKKPNPSNGNQQLWDYGNGSLAIFGNEQLLRLQIEGKDLLAPPGAAASATPK